MTDSQVLAQESGYEIRRAPNELFFLYRRTFAVGLAACIIGGLALFAGVWCVIVLTTFYKPGENAALIAGLVLVLLFALFLTVAILCLKAYLRRRRQNWDEVKNILVADLAQGVLRKREGDVLCSLAEVRANAGVDLFDHTGGVMRVIDLNWRGGSVRVFKTNSKAETQRVLKELEGVGIVGKK